MSLKIILAVGAAALSVGAVASAQPQAIASIVQNDAKQAPIGAGEGRAIALKLADDLLSSFVFRDKAEDYAAMLRKNAAAGRYDTGKRGDVAKLMTEDLLAVHKDGHLRVFVASQAERKGADSATSAQFPAVRSRSQRRSLLASAIFASPPSSERRRNRRRPPLARREPRCEDIDLRSPQSPWCRARRAGRDLLLPLRAERRRF